MKYYDKMHYEEELDLFCRCIRANISIMVGSLYPYHTMIDNLPRCHDGKKLGSNPKCIDDVTVTKTITVLANQKLWLTGEVYRLLKARNAAFRAGDEEGLKTARANLSKFQVSSFICHIHDYTEIV